ncbi:MAG: hypothetical protein K6E13_08025 [Lachnospiraceae bacterium]|nr:hypothetical protein [Lachnospiraceae bacterium]
MREKKNTLNYDRFEELLAAAEVIIECVIASMIMAVGTVGGVILFSGIGIDTLGTVAFIKFSVVATVVFFIIFMGNFNGRRKH